MIISNLKKTYNGRLVLNIDSLELAEGKIHAVVGTNGSGKSTLSKLCAGIIKGDSGYVKCGAKIGYLPQKSYAFRMSTRKNLRINGKDEAKAGKLLDTLKMTELESAKANKLSGGETARMALARLLMRDYELLILDEPTAAMDIESTLISEKLVREYRDRTGCTVLLITHSIAQAERLADEAIFISGGEIVEHGEALAVLKNSKEEKTKEFIEFYKK